MRDDSAKWTLIDIANVALDGPGVALRPVHLARQTLVSGVGAQSCFQAELGAPVGWPEPARGAAYAVSLRRDRVLLVDGPALEDGWDAARGLAVSDMSGAYAVFDLSGPRIGEILARGGEIDPAQPSRSAARRFAGLGVILYHRDTADRLRFHVLAGHAQALVSAMDSFIRQIES